MFSGWDFEFSDFLANGLTPLLQWSTLLWLLGVGLVFVLVPDIFGMVVDVVRILFNPSGDSAARDKVAVNLGGTRYLVDQDKLGQLMDIWGLQDIGKKTETHTLAMADENGAIVATTEAEFYQKVKKS